MKRTINKKFNILEILLIISPIIDILTSITQRNLRLSISIGTIIRGAFLAFMVVYLVIKSNYKYKKISIIYLLALAIYFMIYIASTYINKRNNMLFELSELIKAFYFPICIVTILNYMETERYTLKPQMFFAIMLEYITLLFIPAIFKLGYGSYTGERVGQIGFFFSGNEVSAIYSILFPFIVFSYDYIKNKILYFAMAIYSLYTIMQVGTKLPAIAAIISILGFTVVEVIRNVSETKKEKIKFITIGGTLSIACLGICLFSPISENFYIYKDYLISTRETELASTEPINEENKELLNIENEEEIIIEDSYVNAEKKDEQTLTSDEMATIINSGRIEVKDKLKNNFKNYTVVDKLIGLGKIDVKNNTYNLSEIDYYDIFFNFGYLGFILYFMPIITLIIFTIRRINLSKIKEIIYDNSACCYGGGCAIAFILCAISGHAFVAPSVSIFISLMILGLYKKFEKGQER